MNIDFLGSRGASEDTFSGRPSALRKIHFCRGALIFAKIKDLGPFQNNQKHIVSKPFRMISGDREATTLIPWTALDISGSFALNPRSSGQAKHRWVSCVKIWVLASSLSARFAIDLGFSGNTDMNS